MPIKIKTQKDILATEFSVELPTNLNEIDTLMRVSSATGTIIATYNQGGLLAVNVKQNKKVSAKVAEDVRKLVGVETKEMD